jgi:hypothetical protein
MGEHNEVKSENARNVILSYGENVYFVNKVNVQISDDAEKLKAIFHARRVPANAPEDLNIEINQKTYNVLTEYAKMDNLDMILVLQIQDADAKWCLMSENWVPNQAVAKANACYIV